MALGNQHLGYKTMLNELEARSPRAKAASYLGFLERMGPLLAGHRQTGIGELRTCDHCGAPTFGDVCAFCHLVEIAAFQEPLPVELLNSCGRRR